MDIIKKIWENSKINKNNWFLGLFIIIFFFLAMVSCGIGNLIDLPTMTPSPTLYLCPEPQNIDVVSPISSPKLIVVLFDANNGSTQNNNHPFDIILNLLPDVLEPGDRIFLFQIGDLSFTDSLIFRGSVDQFAFPSIPLIPTFPPTSTPEPTPTPMQSSIGRLAQFYQSTQSKGYSIATATQRALEYNCAMKEWENNYLSILTNMEATRTTIKNEFSVELQNVINNIQNDNRLTPSFSQSVLSGLNYSSIVFENECERYNRCILLIFDDLKETQIGDPEFNQISLDNVEILSIMLNCYVIYQPSCLIIQDYWTDQLLSFGAESITYLNNERLLNNLIDFLSKR